MPSAALVFVGVLGCAPTQETPRVADRAVAQRASAASRPTDTAADKSNGSGDLDSAHLADAKGPVSEDDAIAVVDGRPISRRHLVDLLIAGHGAGMLEQLIVLEKARKMAADQGIVVTRHDIDAELDRTLRNLLSPIEAANELEPVDQQKAEQLLQELLARRNISRTEFMDVIERNTYLRAIAGASLRISDAQIENEFRKSYDLRVEVRHIQVQTIGDARKLIDNLNKGADFAKTARENSANLRTAPGGGLLPPFSMNDEAVPKALRDAAFQLQEGEISAPIRVDDWFHIIRVERRIPAQAVTLVEARPEIELRLRQRMMEPAVQQLYRTLFDQADIKINDPVLKEDFERKHPEGRARSK